MPSITIIADGCTNFRRFLVEGTRPNEKKIDEYVQRSLMLVTALAPVNGDDKASKIAHHAMENDLTLKDAALQLGFVTEIEFDRIVDPKRWSDLCRELNNLIVHMSPVSAPLTSPFQDHFGMCKPSGTSSAESW